LVRAAPVASVLFAIQGVMLFFTAWNAGWVLQAHECSGL